MAKQGTLYTENSYVYPTDPVPSGGTLYLTEGLHISANPENRKPLPPIDSLGGGGFGFGGWGLNSEQPRGTGSPNSKIGKELAWRRVYLCRVVYRQPAQKNPTKITKSTYWSIGKQEVSPSEN
ncbi:hypothetical protein ACQKPE_13775 [Pseudomonas sp. NPDC089554]|uniref:hypothetical protein n=1 Tax=Pseudomonas sp. NPDC089554 TaxID=3390653 RepID=UPI003D057EE2